MQNYIICIPNKQNRLEPAKEYICTQAEIAAFIIEKYGQNSIDYDRIFGDNRCKNFQYFHKAKQTIAKTSYKKLAELFINGHEADVYISKSVF